MYPSPVYLGLNFSEVLGFFMIISSQEFFALTVCHYLRFILVTYSHFPCASFGNFQFFSLEKLFDDDSCMETY